MTMAVLGALVGSTALIFLIGLIAAWLFGWFDCGPAFEKTRPMDDERKMAERLVRLHSGE